MQCQPQGLGRPIHILSRLKYCGITYYNTNCLGKTFIKTSMNEVKNQTTYILSTISSAEISSNVTWICSWIWTCCRTAIGACARGLCSCSGCGRATSTWTFRDGCGRRHGPPLVRRGSGQRTSPLGRGSGTNKIKPRSVFGLN